MDFQPMKYVYKASGISGAHTLLLLHGTGGNEHDLLSFADFFPNDLNILSIRGNVEENGMPRFFKRIGMGIFDEKDLEFRTHEMIAFLKDLSDKENFDVTKLVALGYSNGANIAGSALFLDPKFLAGAILLRPMLPFKKLRPTEKAANVPVFLSSGNQDQTVDLDQIELYSKILSDNGFLVDSELLPTSHNLTKTDLDLAAAWFDRHFSR
ncbi:hypothetical protein [Flavobacterium sp.]|uniref:alpha/beta hydrolase n=1 Tax=Flavobacterium sp. TaxID=239 RepID=UPI00121E4F30|nr:hypothetical protein [Flavobacterium sp.]RZJ69391.1 MAG: carboxylesterase [Flavobacterium sp.]